MHLVSCTNDTHHDVIDLVNHGMVKNTKTNISRTEHNFSMKQKNSEAAPQMANIRSYCFVAEVTFKCLRRNAWL